MSWVLLTSVYNVSITEMGKLVFIVQTNKHEFYGEQTDIKKELILKIKACIHWSKKMNQFLYTFYIGISQRELENTAEEVTQNVVQEKKNRTKH